MKIAIKRVQGQAMLGYAEREQFGAKLKKFMTDIRTLAALLMAGAAFTACSSSDDDSIIEQPVNPAEQTYTMTVTASKGKDSALARAMAEAGLTGGDAQTRALTYDGDTKTLNAAWADGEEVKVIAISPTFEMTECGTLTATVNPSDATVATLSGTLTTAPAEGSAILLSYPTFPMDYTGQKGTLADISANYDYATSMIIPGDWSIVNNHVSVTGDDPLEFENTQAIVRFNLQDKAGNSISATSLTVHEASNKLIQTAEFEFSATFGDLTITPDGASSVIWAALAGVYRSSSVLTLTVTTEDGDTYTYTTKPSFTGFASGQFYSITVKMERETNRDLSAATTDITLRDGDTAYGTMPEGKAVYVASGAEVTLRNATINSVDCGIWCGYDGGDDDNATIILEGENTVKGSEDAPGIFVPEGFTLTIKGSGSLTAEGGTYDDGEHKMGGAGIGGLPNGGNVIIEGGTITAIGGYGSPGIGGSYDNYFESYFGTITIKNTVTSVTAKKGTDAPYCIGPSKDGSCKTITFGEDYYDNGSNIVYNGSVWDDWFNDEIEEHGSASVGGLKVSPNETGDTWVLTPQDD